MSLFDMEPFIADELKGYKGPELKPRILRFYSTYGFTPGEKCGTCGSFQREQHSSKVYFKCARYRHSHGAATDWRVNWPACGVWAKGEL